jgi:hypothetical protein
MGCRDGGETETVTGCVAFCEIWDKGTGTGLPMSNLGNYFRRVPS